MELLTRRQSKVIGDETAVSDTEGTNPPSDETSVGFVHGLTLSTITQVVSNIDSRRSSSLPKLVP